MARAGRAPRADEDVARVARGALPGAKHRAAEAVSHVAAFAVAVAAAAVTAATAATAGTTICATTVTTALSAHVPRRVRLPQRPARAGHERLRGHVRRQRLLRRRHVALSVQGRMRHLPRWLDAALPAGPRLPGLGVPAVALAALSAAVAAAVAASRAAQVQRDSRSNVRGPGRALFLRPRVLRPGQPRPQRRPRLQRGRRHLQLSLLRLQ